MHQRPPRATLLPAAAVVELDAHLSIETASRVGTLLFSMAFKMHWPYMADFFRPYGLVYTSPIDSPP
jgi:hypothetical protein